MSMAWKLMLILENNQWKIFSNAGQQQYINQLLKHAIELYEKEANKLFVLSY